ncbi:MAG: baseplate J/gp47 family protein [Bdellovibrionota bacterium]
MPWFRTQADIEADMLADLDALTGLKLSQTDVSREEVIKIKQQAIAFSHAYASIDRVADDGFPGSASVQALVDHLAARQMPGREGAQPSVGTIQHTGTIGTVILAGNRVRQKSTGKLFYLLANATIDGTGQILASYNSVLSGQDQNVDVVDDAFEMVAPQTNIDNACTNTTRFLDGRDLETPEEMLARIQIHDQNLDTGGNLVAYERFAHEASPAVVSAQAIKTPRGPNTVNTVITSGTTDIVAAVEAGVPVERVPSGDLIALVQAYILTKNPVTDDHLTIAPTEDAFDTTVQYDLYDETLRPTVDAAITVVWKIFVYTALSGQDVDPTTLERQIDAKVGHLIKRRRVLDFGGGGEPEYTVPQGHLITPGVLTLEASP